MLHNGQQSEKCLLSPHCCVLVSHWHVVVHLRIIHVMATIFESCLHCLFSTVYGKWMVDL